MLISLQNSFFCYQYLIIEGNLFELIIGLIPINTPKQSNICLIVNKNIFDSVHSLHWLKQISNILTLQSIIKTYKMPLHCISSDQLRTDTPKKGQVGS